MEDLPRLARSGAKKTQQPIRLFLKSTTPCTTPIRTIRRCTGERRYARTPRRGPFNTVTTDKPNFNNRSFYNDDTLAQAIQQANTEPDVTKANALYGKAQKIIQDEAAGIGLYTQNSTYAIANSLKDVWLEKSQGEPVFTDAYFTK